MIGDAEMITKVIVTRKPVGGRRLRWRNPLTFRSPEAEPILECHVPSGASAYEYQTTKPIEGDGLRWRGFSLYQTVERD